MTTQRRPLTTQRRPLTTQRRLLTTQRRLLTTQRRPLTTQRRPLTTQRRPLTTQRRPLTTQRRPLTTQRQPLTETPDCIVYPNSPEELDAVLQLASEQNWRVLTCGNGSKIDWGGLVHPVDTIASTAQTSRSNTPLMT